MLNWPRFLKRMRERGKITEIDRYEVLQVAETVAKEKGIDKEEAPVFEKNA